MFGGELWKMTFRSQFVTFNETYVVLVLRTSQKTKPCEGKKYIYL